MTRLKTLAALASLLAIAACTQKPIPELVAAVAPNSETPPTLSGQPLADCRASLKDNKNVAYPEQAVYEPGVSYKAAAIIYRTWGAGAQHADKLGAYRLKRTGRNLLGFRFESHLVCFFELNDGRLRFFESLLVDKSMQVDKAVYDSVVIRSYRKMSGKSVLEALFNQ